jgi:biopolymer transport protein ExbD
MLLQRPLRRSRLDPTIGLVDIVFLLVMFSLLAGTVARPLGADVTLIRDAGKVPAPPPDAVILTATGELLFRGQKTDPASVVAVLPDPVRIVPDAAAPAITLVQTARALTEAGATSVIIMTARTP